jgi:uncharacterized protein YndB with AHSA1/START domain
LTEPAVIVLEKRMEKRIVDIEITIAADARRVWQALTGNAAAMMPGTKVKSDWKVGHPIVFSGEWKGKAFEDHGEIQSISQAEEVTFTHWSGTGKQPADYHVVRYALIPSGARTRVTLTQTNVGPKAEVDEKTRAEFSKTFKMMLDQLRQSAEAK